MFRWLKKDRSKEFKDSVTKDILLLHKRIDKIKTKLEVLQLNCEDDINEPLNKEIWYLHKRIDRIKNKEDEATEYTKRALGRPKCALCDQYKETFADE